MVASLERWKKYVENEKLKEMMEIEKKKFMLSRLDKYATKFRLTRLKEGLNAFSEAQRQAKLMKKAINHILKTRTGSLLKAMENWKRLPSKNDQQKRGAVSDIESKFLRI